jgi:hypothetical protein
LKRLSILTGNDHGHLYCITILGVSHKSFEVSGQSVEARFPFEYNFFGLKDFVFGNHGTG